MSHNKTTTWLDYANLLTSALTPLAVLFLGVHVAQLKDLNQALLQKRIAIYDQIAPRLDDIYCFYAAVGHWAKLDPAVVVSRKREIEEQYYVYRFLFDPVVNDDYEQFKQAFFHEYSGAGDDFKLKLDQNWLRQNMGSKFNAEWLKGAENGEIRIQKTAYNKLMRDLAQEITGANASSTWYSHLWNFVNGLT